MNNNKQNLTSINIPRTLHTEISIYCRLKGIPVGEFVQNTLKEKIGNDANYGRALSELRKLGNRVIFDK